MVGQYSKNNLIVRSLKRKYPYDDVDLTLKKPKIVYNISTLDLSPSAIESLSQPQNNQSNQGNNYSNQYDEARQTSNTINNVNTGMSVVTGGTSFGTDLARANGAIIPASISTASEIASAAGPVLSAAGAAASGTSLVFDIASAKKDGKVTFDNAMHIADDATGVVSGIAGMLPGPGTAISLGLTIGEKLVTGGIKAAHAVEEQKKKNIKGETWTDKKGKKHLKFDPWMSTVFSTFTPKWMQLDIGSKEWKQYWKDNKVQKQAQKAAAKKEKAENKARRKEIWKHGSTKDKVKDFFFGV